eukprot:Lankesteria_metandrocarpae@DN6234_c0_g1_i1.p1
MNNASDILNPLLGCFGMPPLPGAMLPIIPKRLLSNTVPSENDQTAKRFVPEFNITDYIVNGCGSLLHCEQPSYPSLARALNNTCLAFQASVAKTAGAFNIAGCLYFAVANLGFACYDAVLSFPQEKAVFNHEMMNGLYSTSSYYLAKNLAGLPFQLVPAMVLVTIYYFMVGFATSAGQFFTYFGLCSLITFCSYGFGYLISALCSRVEIAVTVAPLLLTIYLVLAGFFLPDNRIPAWIDWFKYVTFFRWAWFALCINRWPPDGYYGYVTNK